MSSKMFLSAFAGVATMVVIAAPPQDPSFEYPGAKHIGFDVTKEESALFGQGTEKISVSFKNASIREVLDWLKNAGVSFVVGDDQLSKDSKVSINVMNQPVEQLMKALASSWNGHWEKQKDIWVFKKGHDMFESVAASAPALAGSKGLTEEFFKTAPQKGGKSPFRTFTAPDGNGFVFGPGTPMSKEQEAQLRKSLEKMNDPKQMEEFKKGMEKWSKDYEKNMQEFEKTWKDRKFDYKIDEKALEELRKNSLDLAKAGEKFRYDSKGKGDVFYKMDEKAMKDFQKHAEEMSKAGQKFQYDFKEGGKGFMFDGKDFKPLDEKMLKELAKEHADLAKEMEGMKFFAPDMKVQRSLADAEAKMTRARAEAMAREARAQGRRAAGLGGTIRRFAAPEVGTFTSQHNLKAIYDTLTPTQEIKLKRLGYINYSDLNSTQRALLGVITDDSWTISYKTDKASLTIKSDH